ncbi:thiamine ABC transporter ATP-binding protein [Phaeovulum vinaykumarii]|uniref:Thiamine transport system ATP-binding protein n=1 Tax=Phaeovulum vinaykumarii TaxID=407234 RepID=A0A1N7KRJ3_9RHOB|nr:ATP-binding cassette domain-containing protein [Phaeovulum vinaykumarii]SIS64177.1 thiamine transport system ATP-binding protein [Phaeovulum vinaykumarii]SOC01653.1 thiamine transport system ATP-binding protein [Phaeovulum vinaykumarii]
MLRLEEVKIRQGDWQLAADLSLAPGARMAVLGPSGAGKSTLLGAVAGFVPLAAGRILWEGRDLAPLEPGARPLSILFQDQNLFAHLSVAQNLGLGISPALRLTRADHARIDRALERVGLAGMGARKPHALSGGQQGRVALARALLRARPMLLLDEPFAALGPALKSEMLDLVAEIAAESGSLVLLVTHDPADALRFAPHALVVAEGRTQGPFDTAPLLADPPPALAAYLGRGG